MHQRHARTLMHKHTLPSSSQRNGWKPPNTQDTLKTLKQTCFQGYPESAVCVQGSIDSRNSAIHSAYRISLRPSSLFEPRHPSLKVVNLWLLRNKTASKVCVEKGPPPGQTRGPPPRRTAQGPAGPRALNFGGKTPTGPPGRGESAPGR